MSSNQSEEPSTERDNVEWKLNALLMAGKQAKNYARHVTEAGVKEQTFAPWVPQRLYNSDEKVEKILQGLASANEKKAHIPRSEEQEQTVVLSEEEINKLRGK